MGGADGSCHMVMSVGGVGSPAATSVSSCDFNSKTGALQIPRMWYSLS